MMENYFEQTIEIKHKLNIVKGKSVCVRNYIDKRNRSFRKNLNLKNKNRKSFDEM